MHTLYLALGSNLGYGPALLRRALLLIGEQVGQVECVSDFIESEPQGFCSTHRFTNAVCRVSTTLSPQQCLERTQQIERQMGRTHKTIDLHYTDRLIDIDLLLYDQLHLSTPTLTLPHPRMRERPFVMEPLRQIGGA